MKSKAIYLNFQILNLTLEFVEALRQDNSQNHGICWVAKEHQGAPRKQAAQKSSCSAGTQRFHTRWAHRATAALSGHQAFAWHRWSPGATCSTINQAGMWMVWICPLLLNLAALQRLSLAECWWCGMCCTPGGTGQSSPVTESEATGNPFYHRFIISLALWY